MTCATPWAGLAGPIPLPQWGGPVRVHRLPDEPHADAVALGKARAKAARRAPAARCVPWALLRPGTDQERELLARIDAPWPLLHG